MNDNKDILEKSRREGIKEGWKRIKKANKEIMKKKQSREERTEKKMEYT